MSACVKDSVLTEWIFMDPFLVGYRPKVVDRIYIDGISTSHPAPIPEKALYRNGRIQYNV